jgi:uncharacterized protein involved in exopolysaccharide biosynthesis
MQSNKDLGLMNVNDNPSGSRALSAKGGGDLIRPNRPRFRFSMLRLPIALAVIAGGTCFVVASFMPKQYRSDTTLYFLSQTGGTGGLLNVLSGGSGDNSDKSTPGLGGLVTLPEVGTNPNTAMTLLASDRCREAVAEKCNLVSLWHMPMRAVKGRLEGAATFSVDKHGLLDIEVADKDPKLACTLTQAYVEALYQMATDLSVAPSKQTRIFIEQQLADARGHLTHLETRIMRTQEKYPLGIPSDKLAAMSADTMGQLISARNQAQSHLADLDAEIGRQMDLAATVSRNSLDLPAQTPAAQAANARYRNLQDQFEVAQSTLGPDNPQYVELKLELEQAREAVQKEVGREVTATKNGTAPDVAALITQRDGLKAQIESLDKTIGSVKSNLANMPSQSMRENELMGEMTIAHAQVQMLEAEATRARIAEKRDVPTFETIDPPTVPVEPSAPRRVFMTGFATLAGLLIGIAILIAQSRSASIVPEYRMIDEPTAVPVEAD